VRSIPSLRSGHKERGSERTYSWGLEDFMNVTATGVTNAANLSLWMVNVSQVLMCDFRQSDPDFGVLDLKSYFRGGKYASELLKMLWKNPLIF